MSIGKTEGCLNVVLKVLSIILGFLSFVMIASAAIDKSAITPGIVSGIFAVLIFLISKTSVSKMLDNPAFKNAGVFLSAEQIERLEKAQDIPIVQTPVVLKPGELRFFIVKPQNKKQKIVLLEELVDMAAHQ